jgi:starch phosphorylase
MFDGSNGWAISSAESIADLEHRDEVEANSLFELLEQQIIPLFYDRGAGQIPRGWVTRIKASLGSLGPKVMASRMVRDYLREMYEPIAAQSDALVENGHARARQLAAWKKRVTAAWPAVKVDVDPDLVVGLVDLGTEREVTAEVHLGSLSPDDVAVELLHGPVVAGDELTDMKMVRLERAGHDGGGLDGQSAVVRYRGHFSADQAGRHGYAVRVVPSHRDLLVPVELGCVTWA